MFLSKKLLLFLLKLRENRDGRHLRHSTSGTADSAGLGEQGTGGEDQQPPPGRSNAYEGGRTSSLLKSCFRPQVRFPGNPKHLDSEPGLCSSVYSFLLGCHGGGCLAPAGVGQEGSESGQRGTLQIAKEQKGKREAGKLSEGKGLEEHSVVGLIVSFLQERCHAMLDK